MWFSSKLKLIFIIVGLLVVVILGYLIYSQWFKKETISPEPSPKITQTPASSPPKEVIWQPKPGTSWQWQLEGSEIDQSFEVEMYDVDLFNVDSKTIASLRNNGRKVICYFSAGSWEPKRSDSAKFSDSVKGEVMEGWPDEKWLDIRQLELLKPLMEARLDLCKDKGFDGAEFDNVDGYANSSGFPLTAGDQLKYNKFLAEAAHQRGLSAGLKNDLDQVNELVNSFDWALNEECFQYNECEALQPFIEANKAVFNVEYQLERKDFCPQAKAMKFSSLKKHLMVDAWQESCD